MWFVNVESNQLKAVLLAAIVVCVLLLCVLLRHLRMTQESQQSSYVPKWHLIFYIVATFTVLGISSSFLINHYIQSVLAAMLTKASAEQLLLFAPYQHSIELLSIAEYVIGSSAIVIILLSTYYGRKLARQVHQDDSERMRTQQAFIEAKNMAEKANQSKTEFLAIMSHEIRTPMNGVIGMTDLLAKTALDTRQKAYLDVIQKSGETLMEIINDVLDFSKIEADQLFLETIPFSLRHLAEDLVGMLVHRAEKQGIELLLRIDPNLPPLIAGDPTRIRQILMNLVGNSIKFTKQGYVQLSIHCDQTNADSVALRIEVTDTGIGIPADKLEAIFDRFTQADSSSTRQFGGTGLGLAITKKLTLMMGGNIGVNSTLGTGSTFWCTLDLPILCETNRQQQIDPQQLKGLRLLIVDNIPMSAEIIAETAQHYGAHCTIEPNPDAVLERMQQASANGQPFHITMMNHTAHEPDSLAARISAHPVLKEQTALVCLQSSSMVGDAKDSKQAGFTGYLTKPIRLDDLFDVIALCQQRYQATSPEGLITRHTVQEIRQPVTSLDPNHAMILVVEDNEVNQMVIGTMLKNLGYPYHVASNGAQGLSRLAGIQRYHLVLTDIHMPDMTGLEMAAHMRQTPAGKAIPIVAITADVTKDTLDKILESSINDVLHKPVKLDALRAIVAKWCLTPTA